MKERDKKFLDQLSVIVDNYDDAYRQTRDQIAGLFPHGTTFDYYGKHPPADPFMVLHVREKDNEPTWLYCRNLETGERQMIDLKEASRLGLIKNIESPNPPPSGKSPAKEEPADRSKRDNNLISWIGLLIAGAGFWIFFEAIVAETGNMVLFGLVISLIGGWIFAQFRPNDKRTA